MAEPRQAVVQSSGSAAHPKRARQTSGPFKDSKDQETPLAPLRAPYIPSELVNAAAEEVWERYALLYQRFEAGHGLDFKLLQRSSISCIETLLRDLYENVKASREEIKRLNHSLESTEKEAGKLRQTVDDFISIHELLIPSMDILTDVKANLDEKTIQYYALPYGTCPTMNDQNDVPVDGDVDVPSSMAVCTSLDDDIDVIPSMEESKLRIRVLQRGLVSIPISESSQGQKALHVLHVQPEDSDSDVQAGLYYFQKQIVGILNSILPHSLKVKSLGAWNYTTRNFNSKVLQNAVWDDTEEATEAKELAKGSKGVILVTNNTLKDLLEGLEERTQSESKWQGVPGRLKLQEKLKSRTAGLLESMRQVMERNTQLLDQIDDTRIN